MANKARNKKKLYSHVLIWETRKNNIEQEVEAVSKTSMQVRPWFTFGSIETCPFDLETPYSITRPRKSTYIVPAEVT